MLAPTLAQTHTQGELSTASQQIALDQMLVLVGGTVAPEVIRQSQTRYDASLLYFRSHCCLRFLKKKTCLRRVEILHH